MASLEEIRIEFHQKLVNIMDGNKVYYQPPASVKIEYPCIIYSRNNIENKYANDDIYWQNHSYTIIVIDRDPDSIYVDRLSKFPHAKFSRHYTSDNLNHDVFTIYFK